MSHLRRFRIFLSSYEKSISVKDKNKIISKPKSVSRVIIINKMYVGAFLSQGDNIGHEIVNLYKADDGKNYIYLNSQGNIDLSYNKNIITVLLVRKFAPRTYKILAKAEGVEILDFADRKLSPKDRYKGQVKLGLSYGGVKLVDLFRKNSYRGSQDEDVFTTFLVNEVFMPKNQILITDDKSKKEASKSVTALYFIRTKSGFGKQTLREYFNENQKPDSFKDLNQIIEDENLWEVNNTTKTISVPNQIHKDSNFNFLNIIKQEDNELVFSNMLAYFFNINRKAFLKFAKEILSIDIQEDFIIEREKNNIDLLITDKKNVIVIENKIKSGINGIDARHDIYSNPEPLKSQLAKYYHYVNNNTEYRDKKLRCFIFSPNYNRIVLESFLHGGNYSIIYYDKIHGFFVDNKGLFKSEPYFEDFINAMHKHTKDYDNELEEEMQIRFQNAIFKAKKQVGST